LERTEKKLLLNPFNHGQLELDPVLLLQLRLVRHWLHSVLVIQSNNYLNVKKYVNIIIENCT
jgi:hypothetical protein